MVNGRWKWPCVSARAWGRPGLRLSAVHDVLGQCFGRARGAPRASMTRVAIFLLWLVHFLPLPLLAALGRGLGVLIYLFVGERRRVTLTNLRLCFPEWDE